MHFGFVLLFVVGASAAPVAANVAGWLFAFVVSFAGRFTLGAPAVPAGHALGRYLVPSPGGFAANESAYAALLRWTPLPHAFGFVEQVLFNSLHPANAQAVVRCSRRIPHRGQVDGVPAPRTSQAHLRWRP